MQRASNTSPNKSDRRDLLKLGAAGLPMVMTASTPSFGSAVSALNCSVTVSSGMRMLITSTGRVLFSPDQSAPTKVSNGLVKFTHKRDRQDFFQNAEHRLSAGSVPEIFRPSYNHKGKSRNTLVDLAPGTVLNFMNYVDPSTGEFIFTNGSSSAEAYVAVLVAYEDQNGISGGIPGISCLISIINFFGG